MSDKFKKNMGDMIAKMGEDIKESLGRQQHLSLDRGEISKILEIGNEDVILFLEEKGMDIQMEDDNFKNPIVLATPSGTFEKVIYTLEDLRRLLRRHETN